VEENHLPIAHGDIRFRLKRLENEYGYNGFEVFLEQGRECMVSITVETKGNNSSNCKVCITDYSVVKERIENTFY
jgi:hypothetical protein